MKISRKLSSLLILVSLFLCLIPRTGAEQKFPFDIEFTGELIEGFFFREVTASTGSFYGSVEVMISKSDGTLIFPGDLQFSFPFVKILFSKILEARKDEENKTFRCLEELVRLLTPRTCTQLMVFPDINEDLIPELSRNQDIAINKFQTIINKIRDKASKNQKSAEVNEKFFVIISAGLIREYKLTTDIFTNELKAISLVTEELVPLAKPRIEDILPLMTSPSK